MNGRRKIGEMVRRRRSVILTDRDLHVCRALRKARIMRTGDFVPLIFPSIPVARRRLLKLMDVKVLRGIVHLMHEETRWQLANEGFKAFGENAVADGKTQLRAEPGPHHWSLVRFWSRLAHACHGSGGVNLKSFRFEWEIMDGGLAAAGSFRPDAVFILKRDATRGYWLEIDEGSESPSYFAANKLAVFERLFAAREPIGGVRPDAMLVVAKTRKRLRSLARAAPKIVAPVYARALDDHTTPEEFRSVAWINLADAELGDPSPIDALRLGECQEQE